MQSSTSQRRRRGARLVVSAELRTEAAGCPVFLPPPSSRPPKGIVHFVGGAFAGASPALGYGLLLTLLADGGYTVVATPFAVSFRHAEAASKVSTLFNDAVGELSRSPETSWAVLASDDDSSGGRTLPVHGVGHSMGSLLHLLSCSLSLGGGSGSSGGGGSNDDGNGSGSNINGTRDRASNVLLSFNNRPVGDAVPVSRSALAGAARAALDLSSAAAAALGSVAPSNASSPTPRQQQLSSKALFDGALGALSAAGIRVPEAARAALADAAPAIDQLGSVAAEMAVGGSGSGGDAATAAANAASPSTSTSSSSSSSTSSGEEPVEFVPSPAESRAIIESNYAVPRTFLVKFENDTIDETPSMAALLRKVNAAGVSVATLPGSHVTPCGGELPTSTSSTSSDASPAPSAVDLLAMGGAALLQADTRRLAASVLDWLDRVPRGAGGRRAALPGAR